MNSQCNVCINCSKPIENKNTYNNVYNNTNNNPNNVITCNDECYINYMFGF